MIVLNCYKLMEDIKFMCKSDKYLDKDYIDDRTFDIRFPRSLAKHIQEKELYNTSLRQNLLNHGKGTKVKNLEEDRPTYSKIKMNESSNIDIYMKDYKRRYKKKSGLSRLDFYYEKKIFDKIDYIYDLAKRKRNDKKTYKMYIYSIFAIPFILFASLPFLGLIFPILFGGKREDRLINWTNLNHKTAYGPHECICDAGFIHLFTGRSSFSISYCFNMIISYFLLIMVITVIFYTFLKVIKYEALKARKGKMNRKEYITFCKELLKNK
ncbi:hypothetical protein PVMG_02280 [Plasmodium vivax Mauritania I]|uniref:Variable surface protein n=1 Tax=Plasmodium vivax Mauritania I TaxID=1035515 RepID=A0A0J9TFS5_PLAVI|nr:hypothetical protein PVMG_02280 [Plasmodium vivax Mauritania I]